jgi:hypothetical protein
MSDENPNTTTTPAPVAATTDQPATPPAAGAQPVAFTPEQQEALNRIVQQRLTEDRARRPVAPPATPPAATGRAAPATPAAAATPEPSMSATEVQQLIARDRAFTRVTATAGLTDRQIERMESALRAENPTDVSQWSRDYLADMKLGQPATATTAPPPATATPIAPVATTPAPAAAPSAPSAHALPTANGVVDLFNLTHPQLGALGPQGVRENLEKLWGIGNQASGAPTRPKPPSQR